MRRLAHILFYEDQSYMETGPTGKREIEKVFQGIMLMEKEILEHEDAKIIISVGGQVRIHGVPEALEKKMLDALDDELWYKLYDSNS